MGYHKAGFDVIGVDLHPQPDYPFEFIQGDALDVLMNGEMNFPYREGRSLCEVVAIHASPPCQSQTALTKGTNKGREYPDLIPETRELLALTGLPTVIENVQGSSLRRDLTLCGEMFGLGVIRHRYFEVDKFKAEQPKHIPHRGRVRGWRHGKYFDGPYVAVYGKGGGKASVAEAQEAMGIDWTDNLVSLNEAIPPAYTECIGRQLLSYLTPYKEGDG
ncbi:hypothetical protein KIV63_gp29 [Mycobacterium phage SWU2]|uniref:DNA methylase n=1 Tax=Mycobacterium phage SWU2 TaxID=2077150 RepID=A0A2K9VIE1_9CAUD|nr:hypothetical protein KIV63_gp29 [Mycobacterium phage SWU2]AUV62015.1 hypothetical protein JX_gp56 [Mycobacterium phage SWU2]